MNIRNSVTAVACVTASTFTLGGAFAHAAEPYIAAGDQAADIQPTVDDFRAAVGGGKVAGPNGSFGAARREINWDGVPDAFAPQAAIDLSGTFPANFFNQNSPRGVVFSTPGTGFQVSMDDNNPADPDPDLPKFANINPKYIDEFFELFSKQRLFTAVKSNITDISFFLPGTQTPATTTAFGSVFTDVERDGSKIEYFDVQGKKIGTAKVPIAGDVNLSFAGLVFDKSEIAKVRITSGQVGPSDTQEDVSDGGPRDVVVMDDFIYGEPKIGTVAFSAPTYQIDEDDGTVKVTLERNISVAAANVDLSTADGTALTGSDYTQLTTTVAFAAGESTKTVELPILSDRRAESDETFTVQLANPVELTLGETAKAAVTIRDRNGDATAPSLSLLSATGKTRFRYRNFAKGVKLFLSASEGVTYQASVTAAKVNGTLKTAQGSNNGGIQSLVVKLTKKQVAALQKKRSKSMVIKLAATDQAGNATQKTLTLQLRK